MKTEDSTWPLLAPMVKSVVRAMDATQDAAKKEWGYNLEKFTVTGASKRGWTTWLAGAVDNRVVAIAPMVIDMLNMGPQIALQKESFGDLSEQISDYKRRRLDEFINTPRGLALRKIVDPYEYRDRLTMPKLVILGTNDRYWPLDAEKLYFGELPGEKYLLRIPNNGHGLKDYGRIIATLNALHQSVITGQPLPRLSWEFETGMVETVLKVASNSPISRVRAWTATAKTRDFRDAEWKSTDAVTARDIHSCQLPQPATGFAGALRRGRVSRGKARRVFAHHQRENRPRAGCSGGGQMTTAVRQTTGVPGLDDLLGGGLIPGTLTVVVGATGIGKTQLGLQIAHAGLQQEGRRGILFDCASRGDSQSHAEYARRMFDWELAAVDPEKPVDVENFFDEISVGNALRGVPGPADSASATAGGNSRNATEGIPYSAPGDYLHIFNYHGQRVTRRDLDWDEWRNWQAELNHRLRAAIAFLYGNFIRGVRRVVIDGIEPTDRSGDSIQFSLFEYVYHQVVRKDPEWVARDLLREAYRRHEAEAARHTYDPASIGCVLLVTSHHALLDDLISRPLDEGDVLSNANTLIYLGKTRSGDRIGRGLYIAKHRGSACDERIVPYRIDDRGVRID